MYLVIVKIEWIDVHYRKKNYILASTMINFNIIKTEIDFLLQ